jgi:hypothetical protein
MPFRFHISFAVVAMPHGLEACGEADKVRRCWQVETRTSDDLERDMTDTLQAGNSGAAKSERRGISDGDEDVEGALRVAGGHRVEET